MQDGATSSGLHLEMIECPSLACNRHELLSARLHSLNRSVTNTTMMKLALLAALLALTTAAPARRPLRGHDFSLNAGSYGSGGYGITADGPKPEPLVIPHHAQEAESIERRRLHDLCVHPDSFIFTPVLPAYVRPDGQEIENSIHDRRLHDLWYYAPHINKQEPKPSPERQLKMQAPAQDRDRVYPLAEAGHVSAESPSVSESDEAIESLSQKAPFGF
ncbi:hypothetical protein AC1031_017396 [Aphanomyces cochlioides]|nr:hypothetical protein AC1031_017396 [Aphanomyces cochlioides]